MTRAQTLTSPLSQPSASPPRAALPAPRVQPPLARVLVDHGVLSAAQARAARAEAARLGCTLSDVLIAQGMVAADDLHRAQAIWLDTRVSALAMDVPARGLMRQAPPRVWLRAGLLPLGWGADGRMRIATAHPEEFAERLRMLPTVFHGAAPVIAPQRRIEAILAQLYRPALTCAAAARVPEGESCRRWTGGGRRRMGLTAAACLSLGAVVAAFPVQALTALMLWACFTLIVGAAMKSAAFVSWATAPRGPAPRDDTAEAAHEAALLPRVSILVPLFRETEVASALVARLARLRYPKALLEVVLVLEETDTLTRQTLAGANLPPWMRMIVAPDGQPRTKPRAMNYALDFCRGDIIGIFDAEDAPAPDQIDHVARRFADAPPGLVCLQGVLDYYNPRQTWLARCFTVEYATWFRVMMPGMRRLGFAIPLGGTTLFFRRCALERLGGWDAHNVTEDADLGFRLARHGYRTEMIATATHEEAACHPRAWVKQRSRWLKGYMVTYLVHMRRPRTLLRELGAWRFMGFQTHFITALSQFFLAPLLWSFWLVFLGLPHPFAGVLPGALTAALWPLFIGIETITIIAGLVAVSGPAHRHLLKWVPSLHFYYPLGVLAAYKALYELVAAPFYWDKTQHGHFLQSAGSIRPQSNAPSAPESSLSRVTNALEI